MKKYGYCIYYYMEGSYDSPVAGTAEAKSDLLQPVLVLFSNTNVENLLEHKQSRNDRSFAQGRNKKRLNKLSFINLV